MRENFTNFASTSLVSPSPLSTTTLTFAVTSGTGALFPTSNFVVNIDTEMLFIVSRAGDTFVVAPTGRGFDGTIAAQHLAGSTVQVSMCAYNMKHVWANLPDGYTPDVPPVHLLAGSGVQSASAYDNEFESVGNWTIYPSPAPSGMVFGVNAPLPSHLLLNRGTGGPSATYNNVLCTAYVPFPVSGPFTITTKVSESINVPQDGTQSAECHLFVSDQTNPISSADSGTRFRVDSRLSAFSTTLSQDGTTGSTLTNLSRQIRCSYTQGGIWNQLNPTCPVPLGVPLYLRIVSDGAGNWSGMFGDGYTYTLLVFRQSLSFTPQTIGVQFTVKATSSVQHTCAVDFVRVALTALQPYGG